MKIYSWNVNGIRAVQKKGFIDWLKEEQPDILAIQETKAHKEQLDEELINIEGYYSYFESGVKKGYSSLAIYTKKEPKEYKNMDIERFDDEGRFQYLDYEDFILINGYFPNSQAKGKRIEYKVDYCDSLLKITNELVKQGRKVIICGDYNIAHKEIDLSNPKQNVGNPGFLPAERSWMTKFLENGYIDTFRYFYPEEEKYSWWSYRTKARDRNIGWRIDYFCVSENFKDEIEDAEILNDVMGSDHCPVVLKIK